MYSIYALQDPRNQTVHYIGFGKEAYRRYAMHLLNPGGTSTPKDRWIQSLREQQISPIISILETVETKKEAREREAYWIQHYLALNASLTNIQNNTAAIQPIYERKEKSRKPDRVWSEKEREIGKILKDHGWNLLARKRGQKEYLYAQKWRIGEVYISSQRNLPAITREEVLKKIGVS